MKYHKKDLFFSDDGDFIIGLDGDILDTSHFQFRSLNQSVRTLIQYMKGDWLPLVEAANLNDFKGAPNNEDTAKKIETRIRSTLVNSTLLASNDLSINIVPISFTALEITISIRDISRLLIDKFIFSLEENHAV